MISRYARHGGGRIALGFNTGYFDQFHAISMSTVKRLAGQSAFFFVGNIFTLLVGFVFQIYLAKKLGADGLGLFGLLESGVGIFTALLGLGIAQTAMRYIPSHLQDNEIPEIYSLIRNGFRILSLSGIVGLVLILCLLPFAKSYWPALIGSEVEVAVMSLLIPIGLIHFFSTQVLRGFMDVAHIVIGSTFIQLSIKVFVAVLLLNAGIGVLGYIWAIVISTIIALIWMLLGIRGHLCKHPLTENRPVTILPKWKGYCKVMYGNSLVSFWSAPLDRFLLGAFLGVNSVGVLMVAKMLYALPAVFLQMFLSIVAPMLSSANAEGKVEEVHRIYHLCSDWLVRISLPLVIFMGVFSEPLLHLFGSDFAEQGVLLLRILLIAQFVSLVCGPVGNVLNMCGMERDMFKISVFSVITSVAILVVFVPLWGLIGAGLSILFGTAYSNLHALYIAKRKYGLKWWHQNYRQWFIPGILSMVVSVTINMNMHMHEMHVVGLAVTLITIYFVFHSTQLTLYGMNKDDREIFLAVKKRLKFSTG
jgi:O-antigen/teichoic acid export membrane protein